jgi:signal transduction histidine kinase
MDEGLAEGTTERRSGLDRRSGAVTAAREAQVLREVLHDMSHALGAVRMLAEVLRRRPDTAPTDPQWDQLNDEIEYLARLARTAIATSRQGAATSVHAVACAALSSVPARPGVVVALKSTDTAFVMTDADRLRRAVANLVDNASRAVGERGRVEIEISRGKDEVEIRVDDDGSGFGAGKPGVASLGLRAVHRFAASAGGRLEVGRSQRGGARVSIVLPLASAFRAPAVELQSV